MPGAGLLCFLVNELAGAGLLHVITSHVLSERGHSQRLVRTGYGAGPGGKASLPSSIAAESFREKACIGKPMTL